jgi:superfamily II DNA or RNA helicase
VTSKEELDRLISEAEKELGTLDAGRNELLERINQLRYERKQASRNHASSFFTPANSVTSKSTQKDKISLFRSLFKGRDDVYAKRFESTRTGKAGYQPACRNEWVRPLCGKPAAKCVDCLNRELIPLTDVVVRGHLLGADPHDKLKKDFTIGVYPMLPDETTWFLAADFDKDAWMDDASAFLDTCRSFNVPAALERSRSGNGGHIWIFFSEPIKAGLARHMGSFLLTKTMERRPEIGLDSYDRFFPDQDTMPKGGFGSLIALPLQKKPRERGFSLFVDEHFQPYPDQWAFLSSVRRMGRKEVETIVDEASKRGRLIGVRMVVTDEEDDEPWTAPPSRRREEPPIPGPLPEKISMVLGNQIYIAKDELTPALRNRLVRIAAFQNPEFYRAQAMRHSTYQIPRVISCTEDFPNHIGMPRGCLDEVIHFLHSLEITPVVQDERVRGVPVEVEFQGALRPEQEVAAQALLNHDLGVLSAATAFGKTVVASYLIAERKVNTLILVHRRQLLDQWISRLSDFLGLDTREIGQIGGGKRRVSGRIDVAILQSLTRKGIVDDLVGEYGYLIVDECHHISASSFELTARQCKAKYVTGLSATVTRKDGHHPIIFMQCGPIRYRVDDRRQAAQRPFEHKVILRRTSFKLPDTYQDKVELPIQEIYSILTHDEQRNNMIVEDVLKVVADNRSPLVLTERKEHLALLVDRLSPFVRNFIVLKGGMGPKQRQHLAQRISEISDKEERLLISTGRYLGEGFDDARLDTLFLALPVSWRGTLAQYAGRLHRLHDSKKEVVIYDYADLHVPVLARMFERRRRGYKAIGYHITGP